MQFIFDWVKGIIDSMFVSNASSDITGIPNDPAYRSLQGVPIFGGEKNGGGLFSAFGSGASGLIAAIEQINTVAVVIGFLLLFMSLFLCVFGLVQASIEGDPRGVTEARTGLITCFISLAILNLVPEILGIFFRIAGTK